MPLNFGPIYSCNITPLQSLIDIPGYYKFFLERTLAGLILPHYIIKTIIAVTTNPHSKYALFCQCWWTSTFSLAVTLWYNRDSDIRDRCGPDASLYLSLERYLIVLLLVLSLLSLAIILPVNYSANSLQCGMYTYIHTCAVHVYVCSSSLRMKAMQCHAMVYMFASYIICISVMYIHSLYLWHVCMFNGRGKLLVHV